MVTKKEIFIENHVNGPLATILQMSENAEFHDLQLVCENGKTFSTSRLIIASASGLFKFAFQDVSSYEEDIVILLNEFKLCLKEFN